jgi:hypothetical protein
MGFNAHCTGSRPRNPLAVILDSLSGRRPCTALIVPPGGDRTTSISSLSDAIGITESLLDAVPRQQSRAEEGRR